MKKFTSKKIVRFFASVTVLLLVVTIGIGKLIVSNSNNFNGRKVVYVAASYGVGGVCSYNVYDKLKRLDYTCIDNSSINRLFVNADIKRSLPDATATGRTIFKVDADVHSTTQEIDTGNPESNSNTNFTMIHLDKVYSVEVYEQTNY